MSALLRKYCAKTALLLALCPMMAMAGQNGQQMLPDLGDSSSGTVSPEYERRLGQIFLKQVRQVSDVLDDPEVEAYIAALGSQLANNSDAPSQPFTFLVMDNPRINAFAGPGGVIGINTGVFLHSANESEVAAVIAHEIAHVTQRHLARSFEEASRYKLPRAAAIIGAIIISIANPQAGAAALAGIQGLDTQNQINFTRANEEEADRIGMQILVKAGYEPHGMPSFFGKLKRLSRYVQNGAPEFLRTHPLTTNRIADAEARAARFPTGQFEDSLAYRLIRRKLSVNSLKNPKKAILSLRKELETNKGTDPRVVLPLRYGLACAYIANGDFPLAEHQLSFLLRSNADESAYLLLAAELEKQRSDYDAAFKIYEKAYALYPDYKPVVMAYSRALLNTRQGREARKVLKNFERTHVHDLKSYSLLGQAEALLGNEIEVAILQAEYYRLAGDITLAIEKLLFVQKRYALDYYYDQRVTALMSELEYELELQKGLGL